MEYRGTAKDFGAFLDRTVGKVGYLIGTRGALCDAGLIARMRYFYPTYTKKIDLCAAKWIGMVVADCLGWCEMFENGGDYDKPLNDFKYPDRRTANDYSLSKSLGLPHGLIATLPNDKTILAVGYEGHVGYFYKGMVYQSAGHCSGTIITDLTSTAHNKKWEYWYTMPYLDYREEIEMKQGDSGANVVSWRDALIAVGIWTNPITDSTNFGPYSVACTNIFKKSVGLPEDGVVDETTWSKMLDALRTNTAELDACKKELENTTLAFEAQTVATSKLQKKIDDYTTALQALH